MPAASAFSIPWALAATVIQTASTCSLLACIYWWQPSFCLLKLLRLPALWSCGNHAVPNHGTGNPTLCYVKYICISEPHSLWRKTKVLEKRFVLIKSIAVQIYHSRHIQKYIGGKHLYLRTLRSNEQHLRKAP